jgi:DNA-directed RNA polymerase
MLIIAKILVYNKTNKKIIVNNPILFDASCNGLQHLSALTREINIAIETNLIKDNSNGKNNDLPKDFYNFAGNIIQNKIDNSNIENITKLNLNRSLIKKTVMTIPYNISLFGVKEQLEDKFTICKVGNKTFYKVPVEFTKDNKDLFLYPNEIMKLADLIYNGLIDNLPSLRILNLYLDQMLNILLNLNKPIV